MKPKVLLSNLAIAALSCAIGLLLSEFVARLVLSPSDYLSVEMIQDDILGAVPSPNTLAGGFDEWGFRNRRVPKASDVVAIGDSHTYGNTASMRDSWPYVLGELTGETVYNMGMGGYGPNQYFHLLKTKALQLTPRTVVLGLYIGDDFENAYLITYGLPHWASLRLLPTEPVNSDIWETPPTRSWHKGLRVWLSRNSVVYQLLFHGPLLGRLQGETQIRTAAMGSEDVVSLAVPEKNILEAFRPKNVLRVLDQDSASVREGMRITFELLAGMNEICVQNDVKFIVLVIPTKEMVFAEYIEHQPDLPLNDVIDRLLANEREARTKTFEFLNNANIVFIDVLPALRNSLSNQLYVRTSTDMHPNRNGYRVIAQAAFRDLTADAQK